MTTKPILRDGKVVGEMELKDGKWVLVEKKADSKVLTAEVAGKIRENRKNLLTENAVSALQKTDVLVMLSKIRYTDSFSTYERSLVKNDDFCCKSDDGEIRMSHPEVTVAGNEVSVVEKGITFKFDMQSLEECSCDLYTASVYGIDEAGNPIHRAWFCGSTIDKEKNTKRVIHLSFYVALPK